MKKAVVVLSIAFILLLLVSGIASAGFWQDITGKVSLFLFRKELQAIEPPTACAHPTEPAELVHLLDIGNVSSIVLHPTMQNIIYAEITPLMHSPSLYRSADSGRTWQLIGDYRNVAVNKIQPNRVYASRGNKIYESLDYGLTFSERDTLPLSGSSWEYYITTIFTDRFDWEKVWIGTRNEQYGVFLLDLSQPHAEFKPFNLDVPLSCSETLRNRLIWAINQDPANRNILYFLSEDADHDFYEGFNVMRDACPGMISPHQYSIIRTINEGNTFQTFSGNAGWHGQNIFPIIGHGETKWYFAIEGDAIFLSNGSEVMQWQLISSTPRLGNEAYYEPTRGYNVITDYINNPINLSQHFISTYAIDFLTREIISGAIWQFNPKNNQWNNIISIPGTIISSINIDNCVDNIYFSSFTGGVYVIRNINNGDIIDKPFGEACSIGEICSKETLCINWSATIGNYRCACLRDEGCNYERVCLGARCKIPTGGECDIRRSSLCISENCVKKRGERFKGTCKCRTNADCKTGDGERCDLITGDCIPSISVIPRDVSILEVYKESDDAISIKVQTSFLNKEIKAVATSQEVQTQEPDDSSIKIARAQAIKRKFWSRLTGKVISILAR